MDEEYLDKRLVELEHTCPECKRQYWKTQHLINNPQCSPVCKTCGATWERYTKEKNN